jgi:hypothetical protein
MMVFRERHGLDERADQVHVQDSALGVELAGELNQSVVFPPALNVTPSAYVESLYNKLATATNWLILLFPSTVKMAVTACSGVTFLSTDLALALLG